jgi:hypothetical protein
MMKLPEITDLFLIPSKALALLVKTHPIFSMGSHQVGSERHTGVYNLNGNVCLACVSLTLYLRVITRRKKMECQVKGCTNTSIVFSGTDAFMLGGIPTEKYCYSCANAYAQIDQVMKAINA